MRLLTPTPGTRSRVRSTPTLFVLGAVGLPGLLACGPTESPTPSPLRCAEAGALGEIYVPEDCTTLDEAAEALVAGGTILVGRGVFSGGVEIGAIDAEIIARDGAGSVVIDVAGAPSAFSIEGGQIHIEGLVMVGAHDHVVSVEGGGLVLKDVELRDSTGDFGVGLYAEGSTVTLTGVLFQGNVAQEYGAALVAVDAVVTGSGIDLIDNDAGEGPGAVVWASGASSVELTGGSASGNGGGGLGALGYAALTGGGDLVFRDLPFTDNTVGAGSAFSVDGGSFTLERSSFDTLPQGFLRGALETLTLTQVEIGGAGAIDGSAAIDVSAGEISLDTVTVRDSAGPEGAVVLRPAAGGQVVITGSTFTGNTADAKGGAVFIDCGEVGLPVDLTGTRMATNLAVTSGAGALRLEGCAATGGDFDGNVGVFGGAVGLFDGASLAQARITNNSATDSGGGVHIGAPSGAALPITVAHTWLAGNTAVELGGGINLRTSPTTLHHLVIVAGEAGQGGGIYSFGATTSVRHVTVVGNEVLNGPGGGLQLDGGTLSLTHAIFSGNKSPNPERDNLYVKTGTISGQYNLFFGAGTDGVEGLTLGATDQTVDPGLVGASGGVWTFAGAHLGAQSPAVDTGDAATTDPDGGRADLGAFGGAEAGAYDLDGDGVPGWFWPGAADAPPGGVDGADYDCDDLDAARQGCGP